MLKDSVERIHVSKPPPPRHSIPVSHSSRRVPAAMEFSAAVFEGEKNKLLVTLCLATHLVLLSDGESVKIVKASERL